MENVTLSSGTNFIESLVHLSDIHIRLYQYHDVYETVFRNLYEQLDQHVLDNSVIVITGDLLHSKNQLSPECTNVTIDFLEQLARRAPTLLVAGNHDALLDNANRLDSISSILYKRTIPNLHYLKDSGIYTYNNIDFYVDSLLDSVQGVYETIHKNDQVKVGLYHGQVIGWENNFGFSSTTGDKGRKEFQKMDYVLLGDIHKHQFLEKNMAYAGSLVSQNCGETDIFHGYLWWDIGSGKTSFHKVDNPHRFVDVTYHEDRQEFLLDGNWSSAENIALPSFAHCRLFSSASDTNLKLTLNKLRQYHPGVKFILSHCVSDNDKNQNLIGHEQVQEDEKKAVIDYISSMFSDKTQSEAIIHELLPKWQEISSQLNNVRYDIFRVEFSNMFSYGAHNTFEFQSEGQIYGLFGENATGKSSFADILTYLLCGKITRYPHGNTIPKEIIHHQKDRAEGSIVFSMGDLLYIIVKKFVRQKNGKIKVQQKFYNLPREQNTPQTPVKTLLGHKGCHELTGEQRKRTDDEIEKTIGNFQYFAFNNFFFQQGEESFRSFAPAKKKRFLIDLFGYGWIETLEKQYREEHKTLQIELSSRQKKLGSTTQENFEIREKELMQEKVALEQEKVDVKSKLLRIQDDVKLAFGKLQTPLELLQQGHAATVIEKEYNQNVHQWTKTNTSLCKKIKTLEESISFLRKTLEEPHQVHSEYESKEVYRELSPFFHERSTKWKSLEASIQCFVDYPLSTVNAEQTQLQKELDQIRSDMPPSMGGGTFYKNLNCLEEVEKRIRDKKLYEKKISKKLEVLTKKTKTFSTVWRENLSLYHEQYPLVVMTRHNFNLKHRQVEDATKIRFNARCTACSENPYYLNRVKLEQELQQVENELKAQEGELKKLESFFSKDLEGECTPKSVQQLLDEQMDLQKEMISWQQDAQKAKETIDKLENTRQHLLVHEKKETIKSKKSEIEALEKEKSLYISFLENKEVYHVVRQEWKDLQTYTLKERQEMSANETLQKHSLSEKESLMETTKQEQMRLQEIMVLEAEKHDAQVAQLKQDEKLYQTITLKEGKCKALEEKLETIQQSYVTCHAEAKQQAVAFSMWQEEVEECHRLETKMTSLHALCRVLDKDALPCFLLTSKFPVLEEQINETIQLFLDGRVRFRLEDKQVEIGVETRQGTSSFLSGMESFVVDLAIKLCFSKYSVHPRSNFFLIDEHVSVLDKERLSSVRDMLDVLSSITSNVILISHLPQIGDFVTKSIHILKNSEGNILKQ